MEIPKPTDADRELFHSLVPDAGNVEIKPLFGNLGAFVNGNMFMGLLGSDIGLKLDDDDRAKLAAQPGAGPFGPAERPMGGYVRLPAGWTAQAEPWIARAHAAAASLRAKRPKARKKASK